MKTAAFPKQPEGGAAMLPPQVKLPRSLLRHRYSSISNPSKPLPGALGIEPWGDGEVNGRASWRSMHVQAARVARVDLPVLLVGQSTAGRGIVARMIHDLSYRRSGPFHIVRCREFRADALERELFGETQQVNSGLRLWQLGRLQTCFGGTLVLDEITALPWRLQARLVEVMDGRALMAVGDDTQTSMDVRILATSREEPAWAVASGKLRQDLYYRLHALILSIPPLRREEGSELLRNVLAQRPPGRYLPVSPKTTTHQDPPLRAPFLAPWRGTSGADLAGAKKGKNAVGLNFLAMTNARRGGAQNEFRPGIKRDFDVYSRCVSVLK